MAKSKAEEVLRGVSFFQQDYLPHESSGYGNQNVYSGNLGQVQSGWQSPMSYTVSSTTPSTRYEGATLKNLVTTKGK